MTTDIDVDALEVTQADRDAAASGYFAWVSGNVTIPNKMRDGRADEHSIVQAFARHRLNSIASYRAQLAAGGDWQPIDMILHCPKCGAQHVDAPAKYGERIEWNNPPHRSHLCHGCGCIWRPADVATNGVLEIQTTGKADNWYPNGDLPTPTTDAAKDAEIRQEAQFLLDRLSSLEFCDLDDTARDFFGHVAPSAARLRALLSNGGANG